MQVKITLSRAHKVTERIKALLAELSSTAVYGLANASVPRYTGEDQVELLSARSAKGIQAVGKYFKYNQVLTDLRLAISKANTDFGVSELLGQQEMLSRNCGLLKQLLTDVDVNAVAPSQLKDVRIPANPDRYRDPDIIVTLLTAADRAKLEADMVTLKKEMFVVSDKIADANANKITIELDEAIAADLGF